MIIWDKKYSDSLNGYTFELRMDSITAAYLLAPLKRELKRVTNLYEKYKDIHESGDATRRQQTMMVQYHDTMLVLESIIDVIEPTIAKL